MSLNLALVLSGDNSGAKAAIGDTRTDVQGLGNDARSAADVFDQEAAAAGRVTAALNGQTAAENNLRGAIERRLGVSANSNRIGDPFAQNAQRAADIEAYGRSLDALRARFSPLFAAEQRHLATLQEINNAARVGAINEEERAAAIATSTKAYQTQIAVIRTGQLAAGSSRQFAAFNSAQQLQDIFVSSQFQSPMTIGLQQGLQLGTALQLQLGEKGAAGAVGVLGEAFTSLLSPINLVAVAGSAAAAAILQYISSATLGVPTLDDLLKTHEANIKRLGPAYDDARKHEQAYVQGDTAATVNFLNKDDLDKAVKLAQSQLKTALGKIFPEVEQSQFSTQAPYAIRGQFAPFKGAIDALVESAKSGAPDINTFNDAVARIGQESPGSANAARQLIDALGAVSDTVKALPQLDQPVNEVELAFGNLELAIQKIDSAGARDQVQQLFDKAKDGKLSIDQVVSALDTLAGTRLDLSGPIGALEDLFRAAVKARNAANPQQQLPDLGTVGPVYSGGGKFIDANDVQTEKANATKSKYETEQEKLARGAGRAANAYRDLVKSAQDRIAQLQIEIQLTGKTGAEADKLAVYQDLLSRATDHGRTITEAHRKELEKYAGTIADLKEKVAGLQLIDDLTFQRQQLGRTQSEQQVAADLRSRGIDINSAIGQEAAAAERTTLALTEMRDTARGALSTFIGDLMRGADAWTAFGDAAMSILDKIINKIEDELIAAIFDVGNAGGGMGAGGGILGWIANGISSIFSGGPTLPDTAPIPTPRPSFDIGGWTGPGGKFQPKGIVHAEEFVFSSEATRAIGVGNLNRLHDAAKRGFAEGGYGNQGGNALAGRAWGGGGAVFLTVNNNGEPADVSTKQTVDSDGNKHIEVMLDRKIDDRVLRPSSPANRGLRGTYGLKEQVVVR